MVIHREYVNRVVKNLSQVAQMYFLLSTLQKNFREAIK